MTDAQVLGVVVAALIVVALCLAAFYWRTRDGGKQVVTIDLRSAARRGEASDPVTGLLHGSYFQLTLNQRLASARRHLQPLSLIVFELDGFGRVRPELRDQALRLFGGILRRTLRESDTACRYGEMAIAALLEDTPESGAATAAERVRRTVTASPVTRYLHLSTGIACYPTHALEAPDLLRQAIQALAAARARGRDQLEIAGGD
jgi:diguanylate cyclase (GGDEF)-like protein